MGFWDDVKKKAGGLTANPLKKLASGDVGGSFKDTIGNSLGGEAAQGLSGIGGKLSASWKNIQGKKHDSHTAENDAAQMQAKEDTQYGKNQEYNKKLGSADDDYLGSMHGNVNKYQGDLDKLRGEIEGSQQDSKNTYSNQIQPRLKNLMESAQKNSAGAMSLQDAMDPNNAVATKTRQLYAQQAQNESKAGLADTATLQALGMQNMAGQMGNVPMSGGQLQALMGANQAQSGAAFARTQKRTQDLQDQGLKMGYDRSDLAYDQGRQANTDYNNAIGNYESGADRQSSRDADYRTQRGNNLGQGYNLQQSMNDATRAVGQGKTQRDMAIYNTHMGGKQANVASDIAGINANNAANASMVTGGLQAGGTVIGGIYGGPAGAAAGNQAGQAAGNAMAPDQNTTPGYGNYNPNGDQVGPPVSAAQGYPNATNNPGMGLSLTGGGPQARGRGMPTRGGATGGRFQANPYAYQQGQDMQRRGGGQGARR